MPEILANTLDIGTLLVLLAFFWQFGRGGLRQNGVGTELVEGEASEALRRVRQIEERLTELERKQNSLAEYVDERAEQANKTWRKIRAAQRRAEEPGSGEEGGKWEQNEQLSFEHENGSPEEELPSMYRGMGEDDSMALEINRAIAMRIAGGN